MKKSYLYLLLAVTFLSSLNVLSQNHTGDFLLQSGSLMLGNESGGNNRRLYFTNSRSVHFITVNGWWTEFTSHDNEGWRFKDQNSTSVTFNTDGPYIFHGGDLWTGYENKGGNFVQSALTGWRDILRVYRSGTQIAAFGTDGFNKLQFFTGPESHSDTYVRMTIDNVGNVGIGTTAPDEKLTVQGTIKSEEIKVEVFGAPDYVFADDYDLRSLEALESEIERLGHLPEVPSAAEMEREGIEVGEMNMLLLKKIEELTLYLIEQDEKLSEQDKRLSELEDQNKELREELNH